MSRIVGIGVLFGLILLGCAPTVDRVVIAAGTTLVDSGILDALVERYEADHPEVQLSVVGESTARVLELGRRSAADVLITHAPDLEREFVAEGRAARYEPVLESRYVLVGPLERIGNLPADIDDALRTIATHRWPFVSRADGSGTNHKELELWNDAGIDPASQAWYVETGQGMGLTLQVADQREAFTLSELGAFVASEPTLSLAVVELADDRRLANPYHLIVVAAPDVQIAADGFAEWMLSEEGSQVTLALNADLFGEVVYQPAGAAAAR